MSRLTKVVLTLALAVALCGPRGFSSPRLDRRRTFSQRFTAPGTYRLFCSLHPVAMTATVKVR